MAEDLIDKIIDREAIKSDVDYVTKSVNQIADLIKQMKTVQGATGTAKSPVELNANVAKNNELEKQYQDALKQTQDALNKKAAAAKQLTLEDAKVQEQTKKTNAEIRQQAKEAIAAEGSIEKLRAKLAIINAQKNKLDISTDEYTKAEADVLALTNQIKSLEAASGDFRRNVGNYAGALSQPFNTLQSELVKIQTQLKNTASTDPKFNKMKADADLLEKVLEGLDKTFGSTKQELRAFTEATKQIGQQFGDASTIFQEFAQEVGSQKDTLEDLQAAINFNSSDTKYLDGIVQGVQGVVGAYGIWESATVLLGEDNKELQESMQKLQAIMTLLQSTQGILNALQSESQASQTLLAAKTWLTNAATSIQATIVGANTAALQTNIAVQEEAVIVTEANAVAQAEQAVTAGVTTAAIVAEGVAMEAATVSTIGLSTALIATGIGALIVAIGVAVGILASKISDWNAANASVNKSNEELKKGIEGLITATKAYDELRTAANKREIDALEKANAVKKAAGATAGASLAMDLQIDMKKQELANNEAKRAGVTKETIEAAEKKAKSSGDYLIFLEQQKQKYLEQTSQKGDANYEKQLKAIDKSIEDKKVEANNDKAILDYGLNIYNSQIEAKNKVDENRNQISKLNDDELRKYNLETARIQANAVMDKNAIILGDERSTLDQRLAAMKSNAEQQKIIAKAELAKIQNDPTQSSTSKAIAEKNYNAEIAKIKRSSAEEERKLKEEYRKRDLSADLEMNKTLINQDAEAKKRIAENENATLEERLKASASYVEDQKKLVDAEYKFKKKKSVLTDAELQALEADHNAKLVSILADGEKQKLDVLESAGKQKQLINKKFNDFILSTTQADVDRVQQYSADVQALNKSLQDKKISQEKYDRELLALTDKYNIETVQAEIEKQRKLIEIGNLSAEEKRNALIKLAELEKQLSDDVTKKDKDNDDAKKARLQKTLDYAKQLFDGLGSSLNSIIDSGFERKKQGYQEQIDNLDKTKEAAIAAANAEAISTGEKADKIAIINANAQLKKEALERRQRELDNKKAKTDRIFQVFQIIGNTAMAITKFLAEGNIAGSVVAGILGAAQLAAVLAAPIPKYKYGTPSHKGGPAWVGDGGVNEVAVQPGEAPFVTPNKPTLMNLKKGTKVYSSIDKYMAAMQNASMMSTLESGGRTVTQQTFDKALVQSMEAKLNETNAELRSVKNAIANIPGVTVNNTWEGSKTRVDRKGSHELWVNDFVKG